MSTTVLPTLCSAIFLCVAPLATTSAATIEIAPSQAAMISWGGSSTGCFNTYWNHNPSIMCGGLCTLNTQTYQYGGKRISLWNFDLSEIPEDAVINAMTLRATGGDHGWSQEGRLFKIGMKPGLQWINLADAEELYGQGDTFAQPAPLVQSEYPLSTEEVSEANTTTGRLVVSVSADYSGMVGVLDPHATLLIDVNDTLCNGDADSSGEVNIKDLLLVLAEFGTCTQVCDGDLDGDGFVNINDMLAVLEAWGPCS
ncbi:MAG: hypothetical protein MK077_08000 [Phycisphaerales bacterium]|nr:hypothetical protein [Phycisphaerales bacterium]